MVNASWDLIGTMSVTKLVYLGIESGPKLGTMLVFVKFPTSPNDLGTTQQILFGILLGQG